MLRLSVPKPCWITLRLDETNSVELLVTPPDYEKTIEDQVAMEAAQIVAGRVACVTDWKDVTDDQAEPQPLPFSRAGLAALFQQFPGSLPALLAELRPLFRRPQGADAKKSPPQSPAAT